MSPGFGSGGDDDSIAALCRLSPSTVYSIVSVRIAIPPVGMLAPIMSHRYAFGGPAGVRDGLISVVPDGSCIRVCMSFTGSGPLLTIATSYDTVCGVAGCGGKDIGMKARSAGSNDPDALLAPSPLGMVDPIVDSVIDSALAILDDEPQSYTATAYHFSPARISAFVSGISKLLVPTVFGVGLVIVHHFQYKKL